MRLGTHVSRTLLLATWAGFFAVLWGFDEGQRYLGPRTQWVIPFGAITLAIAAVAHGLLARRRRAEPLSRGETFGSLALLLPIVSLVAVPQPSLGAQAASMKRPSNEILLTQLPGSGAQAATGGGTSNAPFVDVAIATLSPSEGAAMGLRPGASVRVHGIVVHDTGVPDTFGLARFFVSCCAADALPILVPVDSPSTATRPEQDDWVLVSGTLARRGTGLIVVPTAVHETSEPKSPYLTADDGGTPPADGSVAIAAPSRTPATIFVPALPTDTTPVTAPKVSAEAAGYEGRAVRVYDDFYLHCKRYTYGALAYPQRVASAAEAARAFVGRPATFRKPAVDGCLAGLNAGEATITVKSLVEDAISQPDQDSRRSPGG